MPGFDFIEDTDLRAQAEAAHTAAITEEVKTQVETVVDSQIDEAVIGLKNKNAELLQEKKDVLAKLKEIGDLDVNAAREALEFLQKDEKALMIKEGRIDELISKETSSLKADFETKITEIQGLLDVEKESSLLHRTKYQSKMVDDALRDAAIAAGIRDTAVADVLARGGNVFSLGDDGTVEARDAKNKLIKTDDDLILTPENWVVSLKKPCPHYWPPSVGADLTGVDASDAADMQSRMSAAVEAGNIDLYRKLRDKARSARV